MGINVMGRDHGVFRDQDNDGDLTCMGLILGEAEPFFPAIWDGIV